MFGNSYTSAGGSLSQNHAQAMNNLSSMGMLSDENSNDSSPFTLNDFPQLGSRPNSAGGPQGQIGKVVIFSCFGIFFSVWHIACDLMIYNETCQVP